MITSTPNIKAVCSNSIGAFATQNGRFCGVKQVCFANTFVGKLRAEYGQNAGRIRACLRRKRMCLRRFFGAKRTCLRRHCVAFAAKKTRRISVVACLRRKTVNFVYIVQLVEGHFCLLNRRLSCTFAALNGCVCGRFCDAKRTFLQCLSGVFAALNRCVCTANAPQTRSGFHIKRVCLWAFCDVKRTGCIYRVFAEQNGCVWEYF